MMQPYVSELVTIVDETTPAMLALSDEATGRKPAPGKWSPREIVGHLIDSASNNHQRFVRAQLQDQLTFVGYDQDAWVARQKYQDAPWRDLVALWASFNRHLAHVMASVPDATRTKSFAKHNLHELAFKKVPADRPATLDYFMQDYVDHLKHHLRQIFPR
jgi:DinB family protein